MLAAKELGPANGYDTYPNKPKILDPNNALKTSPREQLQAEDTEV